MAKSNRTNSAKAFSIWPGGGNQLVSRTKGIKLNPSYAPSSYGTLQQFADYMTSQYNIDQEESFGKSYFNLDDEGENPKDGNISFNYTGGKYDDNGLSSADWKNLWDEAFKYVTATLGIQFTEDGSNNADIHLTDNEFDEEDGGESAFSQADGTVVDGENIQDWSRINITPDWDDPTEFGNDAWSTIVHELGHTLGLGHPGNYNGSIDWDTEVKFKNDSWAMTIMSYLGQDENKNISFTRAYNSTYSAADLLALDDLYADQGFGTSNAFTNDTTYGFNTTISSEVSGIWNQLTNWIGSTGFTIADGGGIDTLDFSGFSDDQTIDLAAAEANSTSPYYSSINGLEGNLSIAVGTVIERAIGGSGDDELIGNFESNDLQGSAGDDTLWGNGGDDVFFGGEGDDEYLGGDGKNTFNFDNGNNIVWDFNTQNDNLIISDDFIDDASVQLIGSDLVVQSEDQQVTLSGLSYAYIEDKSATSDYEFINRDDDDVNAEEGDLIEITENTSTTIELFYDNSDKGLGHVYFKPDGGTLTPIKEPDGHFAFLYDIDFRLADFEDGNYRIVHSIKAITGGYAIAIREFHNEEVGEEWQYIELDATGKLKWEESRHGSVGEIEKLFKVDLNNDGTTGITYNDDDFTQKPNQVDLAEDEGRQETVLLTDKNSGDLYMKDDEDGIFQIKDDWGNGIRLDDSDSWDTGSWSREATQIVWDSASEHYWMAVKETYVDTWGGETNTDVQWFMYKISDDGELNWDDVEYNVNIQDYETNKFKYDVDGDDFVGINEADIKKITTDTYGTSDGGVDVFRNSNTGSIYFALTEGGAKTKIVDTYGGEPYFEQESSWEGGSFESKVYAFEKTAAGYALLIKHTDTHDDDYFGGDSGTYEEDDDIDDGDDDEFSGTDHAGFSSTVDTIPQSTLATTITATDHYPTSSTAANSYVSSLADSITITFEADNGWLDVDNSTGASFYTGAYRQNLAGTSTPYLTASPNYAGSTGITTFAENTSIANSGTHNDGTAEGTIEYLHQDGTHSGKRIHFGFERIGHEEGDLVQLYPGANIDRGINTTQGTDAVVGEDRDQFLQLNPSEDERGGLQVEFLGEDNSEQEFANPVDSFGFYLIGRQPKRDVVLEVYDINNNTLYAGVTSVSSTLDSANVEYISFQKDSEDAAIAGFNLKELKGDSENNMRDIYSIDDLTLSFSAKGWQEDLSSSSTEAAPDDSSDDESQSSLKLDENTLSTASEASVVSPDTDNQTTYWEIYNLDSTGKLNWNNGSTYTEKISGYENVFKQDLNGDTIKGVNVYKLDKVDTDILGDQLKKHSTEGTLHIWNGVDENTVIDIKDISGGSPSVVVNETWDDGSFKINPYAVYKDNNGTASDATDDFYRIALKREDSYTVAGVVESQVEWELYKADLNGIINPAATIFTPSITTYEDEFGQDMNGDSDFSGSISLNNRSTDTKGVLLGEGDGQLFIRDGGTDIPINDSWIEENSSWDDGSFKSTAVAVEKNDNGTVGDAADDYYQVAVSQAHTWTDFNGITGSDSNWQVYAVKANGTVDWEKTIWTESIAEFEGFFDQDLNGDSVSGVNADDLVYAPFDTKGYRLKKDNDGLLHIVDNAGDNRISIKDQNGGYPSFDHSYSWGTGSHESSAIAVEQNSDGTFSLAVKHSETVNGTSKTNWEIFSLSSTGVLTWDDNIWTDDISLYETSIFNDDLDQSGSAGFDVSLLTDVDTDTTGDKLQRGSGYKYYISDDKNTASIDDDNIISISYSWGESPDYFRTEDYKNGASFSSGPAATESLTFTDSAGVSQDGFVVAIQMIYTDELGEKHSDWEIDYIKSDGTIDDDKREYTSSIKSKESLFGQDLDGDEETGLTGVILDSVDTDTTGDLLKKDGDAHYIVDDKNTADTSDDVTFALVDENGWSPFLDYQDQDGSGDDLDSESASTFAVESFVDVDSKNKFLLAIKKEHQYGSEPKEELWETFQVVEANAGSGDWYLDSNTAHRSKGVRKLEQVLKMDLNGSGGVDTGAITTTAISTDEATTGLTAVTLAEAEGSLYITKGTSKIEIVDQHGGVNFDFKDKYGGDTIESKAFAVEGIANSGKTAIDSYLLMVKETVVDSAGNAPITKWKTYPVSSTGLLDRQSETVGTDANRFEAVLNQDLNNDGSIWSLASQKVSAVDTDTRGAQIFTDSANNLYVQPAGSTSKSVLLNESGNPLNESDMATNVTDITEKPYAISGGGAENYQLLMRRSNTADDSTLAYWTLSIDKTTLQADWTSMLSMAHLSPLRQFITLI